MKSILRFRSEFLILFIFLIAATLSGAWSDSLPGADDWAYADTVRKFTEGNYLNNWSQQANALPQTLFAFLLVKVFGWSYLILRISTFVAAMVGVFFFQRTCRLFFDEFKSTLVTASVAFSPLYLGFSTAFMSDMMFTALLMVGNFYIIRGLYENSTSAKNWIFGGVIIGLSFLNRQIAVVSVIALIATYFFYTITRRYPWKLAIRQFLLGAAPAILIILMYFLKPEWTGGRSDGQASIVRVDNIIKHMLDVKQNVSNIYRALNYLMAFMFPLIVALAVINPKLFIAKIKAKKVTFFAITAASLAVAILFLCGDHQMTIGGDIVHAGFILEDLLQGKSSPYYNLWLICVFINCGFFGVVAALIVQHPIAQTFKGRSFAPFLFVSLSFLGYFVLSCTYFSCVTNYFLPLLHLLALGVAGLFLTFESTPSPTPSMSNGRLFATATLCGFALTSILASNLHNKFVSTSWKIADQLTLAGVPSRAINTWTSWYNLKNLEFIDQIHHHKYGEFQGTLAAIRHFSCILISEIHADILKAKEPEDFRDLHHEGTVLYPTLLGQKNLFFYTYGNSPECVDNRPKFVAALRTLEGFSSAAETHD